MASPKNTRYFCAELAKDFGLEEAIFFECLKLLKQQAKTSVVTSKEQQREWYEIPSSTLIEQLIFWNSDKIESVLQSARNFGLILTASPPINQTETFRYSLLGSVIKPHRLAKSQRVPQKPTKATSITVNWHPIEDTFQRLAGQNIPKEFALERIQAFVGRYRQSPQKELPWAWDDRFYSYCLSEWRNFEILQHQKNNTAKPISEYWQPNHLFFENLRQTQIPKEFALMQLKPFIMYWMDRGESRPSWNKSFLDYVVYQWRNQQNNQAKNKTQSTRDISIEEKLKDLSWLLD